MTQDPPEHNALHRRPLRSYVLRQGRLTDAQARALDALWAVYGLDPVRAAHDPNMHFPRPAPVVVEIGTGNGEAILFAAQNEPDGNFIGIEVHRPGVGRLLRDAEAAGVRDNLRVYNHDAVEVLRDEIAPASLAGVRIYFPDPWHKKRHNKRRLIQPAFVELLASRVSEGGMLHLATDWEPYAEHMREVMEAAPGWRNANGAGTFCERPHWRPETHFERRGIRLGHGVWDMVYLRESSIRGQD